MALLDPSDHDSASGINNIVHRLESFVSQCQRTIQTLSQCCNGLSSGDATLMLRGFCEARGALTDLERQASDTGETILRIHEKAPYPRFVDKLPDDILRHIFCLAVEEVAPEDIPTEIEPYDHLGVASEVISQPQRFPEKVILVNRQWRSVGLGSALIWTRIIGDAKHPLKRIAKWLERSQQASLSVHWGRNTHELSLLVPHMSRIKSLDVIMRASQTGHFVDLLLQPLAKTSILNSLSLSPVVDYHPVHLDLTSASAAGTFGSLRYFTATSILLGWSWPMRNLLSLHLMNLDVAWPKLQDVLAASPELQQLALVNLKIQDYPSLKDDSRGATLPVFHHLWTIRMSNLGYSREDVHTQPTILHRIRAPAIISLAIDNEYNAWSALSALVLVGKASLENLNVNLMNDPILDNLIAALTDAPALRLKTLTLTPIL
ncbi:hypothetical protein FRB95_001647 [Tulasnella sp. JGI-2019a]|nr:hypothetical protein FRB95_001647 [Tulasnella sp. JGI-2019a]